VLLSSHVLADLEGVCDHLLLLADGRVHLAGDVEELVAGHRVLIGLRREGGHGLAPSAVVEARTTGRQETVLVRAGARIDTAHWDVLEPTLEELAMAYLRAAAAGRAVDDRELAAA
jgi:ABC-2 type transport system ATP-binding protein